MQLFNRILVTGATGFLGRHLVPRLQARYGADAVTGVDSAAYDLMDMEAVRRMFDDIEPDAVFHLAGYSGGIGINRTAPADFYFRNTILTANLFEVAARRTVSRLVYPMGGCSYPATATSPISEDQMWKGYPQLESAGYSAAKKMGIVASESYRIQYGLNSAVVIPGNMYGEYDNFRNSESHVIPAMIRRYYEAAQEGVEKVVMWGTGKPTRDFVYAGDVAAVMISIAEMSDETGPINLSSGTTTSIRDLAEDIKEMTGFAGRIDWDTSKPDGQMIKIFDVTRMRALGLEAPTPLRDGLQRTIAWFSRNYETAGDGIRL